MITVVKFKNPVEVNGEKITEAYWGRDVRNIYILDNAIRLEQAKGNPTIVIPMCNVINWEES